MTDKKTIDAEKAESRKRYSIMAVCLIGALAGFAGASWVMPKIFNVDGLTGVELPDGVKPANYSPEELLAAFGADNKRYIRKTLAGSYLSSQFAQRHKDWENASEFMDDVLKREQGKSYLRKSSMILSMGAGDHQKAIKSAKDLYDSETKDLLILLFVSLEKFKQNKVDDALTVLGEIPQDSAASFLLPVIKLWTDASKEKLNLKKLRQNPIYGYHALLTIDYLQRAAESRDFIDKTLNHDITDIRDLDKIADLLASHGETDRALALYKKVQELGFTTSVIDQKIERIEQKKPVDDLLNLANIKSVNDGISLVFQDMAEILYREDNDDSALVFVQMALYLNDQSDNARVLLANILARHNRDAEAIEAFLQIPKSSKLYKLARKQCAALYGELDQTEKGVAILKELHATEADVDLLVQIGDLYRGAENYKDSVTYYNKAAKNWEDGIPESHWYLLYARGMTYERLGDFKEAEADLEKALSFRPEHPYILNYLGYSLADQGRRLDDALAMIEKAVEILPNDGHIADSLGWVLFRMNRVEEGIPHLENAVELLPYDPIVNDHLGDAYWLAGRKNEARFQWERAVNYSTEKDAEIKALAQDKLDNGYKKPEKDKIDNKK